jgi:ferric-dicitrate binding protein FerR (iron transport regulator)
MTHSTDDRLDACLWDPAAPPDESVRRIEAQLAPARFDPASKPLPHAAMLRAPGRPTGTRWLRGLAAAAAILIVAGASLAAWRWTWPDGRAWTVAAAPTTAPDVLAVGTPFVTPESATALVRIARIGTMRVDAGSRLTLRSTSSNRHRLALEEGTVHVRVWAPPFSVAFHTPAGDVFDMGCEFDLTVEGGSSHVRVTSGWVQLENFSGESIVPAGASTTMLAGRSPGVAVFDDASDEFREALRDLEAGGQGTGIDTIIARARPRDVLTLLQLVQRDSAGSERFARRAFELAPPPDPEDLERVIAGNRAALDRWMRSLPLPSPKSGWWWNWRDALPIAR